MEDQPGQRRTAGEVWGEFPQDPRLPANAALRCSDADRDRIQQVLTEAFADGRLDRSEYDERSTTALAARTLGDLPPLVADLLPERTLARSPGSIPLIDASESELRRRAGQKFLEERRNALLAFLGPTLICWAIWLFVGLGGEFAFPWPLFPTFFTALNLVRVVAGRRDIEARELRSLERRQARALQSRRFS